MTHQHLPDEAIVARLRDTPLFGGLDDEHLSRVAELGEVVDLEPGEALITEGDLADALYVVLDGELEVTKRSGTSEIPVAMVGPGALQGEIAALEGGRRLATVRAVVAAEVLRIPVGAIRELLTAGPEMALGIIGTAVSRLRAMESSFASARSSRASARWPPASPTSSTTRPRRRSDRCVRWSGRSPMPSACRTRSHHLSHPKGPPLRSRPWSAPTGSRTSSRLAGGAEAASALGEAGWTATTLASVPADAVAWLAADASVHQLLGELSMALERIGEIVAAVKGYTYLDQAPVQRVDVRIGLEQTLVILRHRLRDVEVSVDLADGLPEVEAFGSELNQVWTNIIDNAADAMDGRGSLTIMAAPDPTGDGVTVEICNTGPAIPDDVRARLFEPFFTTKEPGRGTGLGLHISHNVIVRHGGRIDVGSEGGRTCFTVTLPLVIPGGSR